MPRVAFDWLLRLRVQHVTSMDLPVLSSVVLVIRLVDFVILLSKTFSLHCITSSTAVPNIFKLLSSRCLTRTYNNGRKNTAG